MQKRDRLPIVSAAARSSGLFTKTVFKRIGLAYGAPGHCFREAFFIPF
jgi:hypothetical protein